jgi:hypothetical protein
MAAGLPTSVTTEIEFTAGVWTDVSTYVKGDSMEISVGADSAASGVQPGTLDLDLDNADGRFTPDNPTSTYYPNFVERRAIRVTVTKGGTPSIRFIGRITSLAPDFPAEPTQSVTHVAAVDLLGEYERITLPTWTESQVRIQGVPSVFYGLADTNGDLGFVDNFDVGAKLTIRDVTPGTGGVDAASDSTLGDGQSYVALTAGKSLWHATPGIPATVSGGSWTVGFLVNLSFSSLGDIIRISSGSYTAGVTNNFLITLENPSGTAQIKLTRFASGATTSTTLTSVVEGWNYIQVNSGGSLQVNGSTTSVAAFVGSPTVFELGGSIDMSIGQLFMVDPVVSSVLYQTLVNIGTPYTIDQSVGQLSDASAAVTLGSGIAMSGLPTYPNATPLTFAGKSALTVASEFSDSIGGYIYQEYESSAPLVIKIAGGSDVRTGTVALTIDAEGDLSTGPTVARDVERNVAAATASSRTGSVTIEDSSATAVGGANVSVTTGLRDTTDLAAVASYLVARSQNQRLRVSRLTVDLATSSNNLYPNWFNLRPGQRLRLSGLPSTYFGFTYIDGYVAGWTERPSVNGYEVTFNLDPADAPPEAVFDDATYSRIPWGDGVCTLTSGITSSATSISLTFTGTALLSTSAGDYPLDLDLNGERVTITSAPAGGTSPRTVTVTRGVAPTVARAHSAGEAIDVWNAARIAL